MREGAIVRTICNEGTGVMALSSLLSAAQGYEHCRELIYIDGSDEGIIPRVNDVLNMAKQLGWAVYVLRHKRAGHGADFVKGLRFAKALGWDRVHHFDDDVLVLPHWFAHSNIYEDCVQSTQVLESSSIRGFDIEKPPGNNNHVSALAMTFHMRYLDEDVLEAMDDHKLSIFEDMKLCQVIRLQPNVVKGIGVCHRTRDTGQDYIRRVILGYADGSLVDGPPPE
jgi:hypothetical protein